MECHKSDTPERVCFYEQDFYVLSNFSSFRIRWAGYDFDTSEHVYHWEKFRTTEQEGVRVRGEILQSRSAHEAFKIAGRNKQHQRPDWDQIKVGVMKEILKAKVDQHEYVRRKLLDTGDRELVEDSWRDSFWGWGPDQKGQNQLGKVWMEIRSELKG